MRRLDDFFHILETSVDLIYSCGEIHSLEELRRRNEQWRWFLCGLWVGMEAWLFIDQQHVSGMETGEPIGWREYNVVGAEGYCHPLS